MIQAQLDIPVKLLPATAPNRETVQEALYVLDSFLGSKIGPNEARAIAAKLMKLATNQARKGHWFANPNYTTDLDRFC